MFLINPYILGGGAAVNPLWDGLQAYYTADNTGNDALGTYDLTLYNGTTYTTGVINNGFSFDGVNDYAETTATRIGHGNSDSFSISCWINGTILNRGLVVDGDTVDGATLGTWNSGAGRKISLLRGQGASQCFGNTTLSNSTLYHLVAVHTPYDGVSANVQFYVNGSADGSAIFDIGTPTVATVKQIGTKSDKTTFYTGMIDEPAIWSRDLSASEVTELYNAGAGKQYPVVRDFLTATGITDSTIVSAINTLTSDLQGYGIWDKLEAIYPFVGGTAETHRYNLKDATQYKIDWNGTITHDSNGVTGDGSTGYGNTNFKDSLFLTNFISFGVYSRTNLTSSAYDMAATNSGFITNRISSRFNASGLYTTAMDGSGTFTSSTDSLGLFCANRTSTTTRQSYIDGVETSHSISSGGYVGENMYVLAQNQTGTANSFSSRNLAFAFIGNSLTTTEHANLYTAVQAFQTTLSRNV